MVTPCQDTYSWAYSWAYIPILIAKVSVLISYKFRAYPNEQIQAKIQHQLDLARWLYNRLLEEMNNAKEDGRSTSKMETQALIVKLKEEHPELKAAHSKVLQMVNNQLWYNTRVLAALKRKGKKVGKLRFKGKYWYKSLNYNQTGFRIDGNRLYLSKIGDMKIIIHREIVGEIKAVIIKREKSGKWFAIVMANSPPDPLDPTGRVVGIDVGLKHFLTDSDGLHIENPRYMKRSKLNIKQCHWRVSKKKKGSKNREKAKIKLSRAYEKLNNRRGDFHHKLARYYVNNYDVISVEDLEITRMIRDREYSKGIADVGWGNFNRILSYKAERAGRKYVRVDPAGTSREYDHGDLDRDYNASFNILERGLSGLGRACAPADIVPLRRLKRALASTVVETGSPLLKPVKV